MRRLVLALGLLVGCAVRPTETPKVFVGHAAETLQMRPECGFPPGCFSAKTLDGSCRLNWCYCSRFCNQYHPAPSPLWAQSPDGCRCAQ